MAIIWYLVYSINLHQGFLNCLLFSNLLMNSPMQYCIYELNVWISHFNIPLIISYNGLLYRILYNLIYVFIILPLVISYNMVCCTAFHVILYRVYQNKVNSLKNDSIQKVWSTWSTLSFHYINWYPGQLQNHWCVTILTQRLFL